MEKRGAIATSKPLGMCEKIFKALKIPKLRPLRLISYKQETAAAKPTAPSKPPAAADSGTKPDSAEPKLPTPIPPIPIQGARNAHVPEKKIAEVAPIPAPVPPPMISEERMKQAQSTEQQKGRLASKIEKEKQESVPPTTLVARQGRPKVSTNPVPHHTLVQAKEKATGKAQAPALTAPAAGGGAHGKPAKVEPTPLPAAKQDKERAGPRAAIENINERVVDYINRAKLKLRADSTVGRP